jgi:hypothetical protein
MPFFLNRLPQQNKFFIHNVYAVRFIEQALTYDGIATKDLVSPLRGQCYTAVGYFVQFRNRAVVLAAAEGGIWETVDHTKHTKQASQQCQVVDTLGKSLHNGSQSGRKEIFTNFNVTTTG